MTPTPWAHLPNAARIDAVLAHVKAHPDRWNAAWGAARDAAWGAAWGAARDAARDAARGAAWGAARPGAAWDAAWGACAALVVYDDCAHFLDMPPAGVRLAATTGHPAAVLLYPACVAMEDKS